MTTPRRLWLGTYPGAGAGTPAGLGEGVWTAELDAASGAFTGVRLAAPSPAPSYLAEHPGGRVLYAVGETERGTVTAFAAGPDGQLEALAVVSSGGADPCHLLLGPDARTLYACNYSSGTVAVLPLDVDGAFTRATISAGGPAQVLGHTGSGPDAERQEAPHAHSAAIAPGGRHLLVVDLGTDELRRYRIVAGGLLEPDGIAATLAPGTGPRHLAVWNPGAGPDALMCVVGELDSSVHVLRWDAATATAALLQTLPANQGEAVGECLPAHAVVEAGLLLVSVRGADVIAAFGFDRPSGRLEQAGEVATGRWPRHFAVVGGRPVVANQHAGTVTVLDPVAVRTCGAASARTCAVPAPAAAAAAQVPAPACVLAARPVSGAR